MVTTSKLSSAKGNAVASPATKAISGWRRLPSATMPVEKSQATTSAPSAAYSTEEVPVPAARSRTRVPGRAATAARVTRRHMCTWNRLITSLDRS